MQTRSIALACAMCAASNVACTDADTSTPSSASTSSSASTGGGGGAGGTGAAGGGGGEAGCCTEVPIVDVVELVVDEAEEVHVHTIAVKPGSDTALVVYDKAVGDGVRLFAALYDGTSFGEPMLIDADDAVHAPHERVAATFLPDTDTAIVASQELYDGADGLVYRVHANVFDGAGFSGPVVIDPGPIPAVPEAFLAMDLVASLGAGSGFVILHVLPQGEAHHGIWGIPLGASGVGDIARLDPDTIDVPAMPTAAASTGLTGAACFFLVGAADLRFVCSVFDGKAFGPALPADHGPMALVEGAALHAPRLAFSKTSERAAVLYVEPSSGSGPPLGLYASVLDGDAFGVAELVAEGAAVPRLAFSPVEDEALVWFERYADNRPSIEVGWAHLTDAFGEASFFPGSTAFATHAQPNVQFDSTGGGLLLHSVTTGAFESDVAANRFSDGAAKPVANAPLGVVSLSARFLAGSDEAVVVYDRLVDDHVETFGASLRGAAFTDGVRFGELTSNGLGSFSIWPSPVGPVSFVTIPSGGGMKDGGFENSLAAYKEGAFSAPLAVGACFDDAAALEATPRLLSLCPSSGQLIAKIAE